MSIVLERDHAVTEIGDDHHVRAAHALRRDTVDLLPIGLVERRVVHGVDFEELVQISELDIPRFAGRRTALNADRRQRDIRADMRADELLRVVVATQRRDDLHRLAEARDMVGRGNDAAGKLLAALEQRGDDVFLRGLSERRDVLVFVDDGVADQHDVHVLHLVDQLQQAVGAAAFADLLQVVAERRIVDVEIAVHQRRGAERHVAREHDAPAVTLDGVALGPDLAGHVVFGILVVGSLHIDVRPHRIEDRLGAGGVIDADPIDVRKRGQHLGPHVFGEDRPARSLVDVTVGGDRHHDDVALVARRLDVPDMAEMHEVEDAVAERNLPAPRLRGPRDLAQFLDCLDLLVRRQWSFRRGIIGRNIAHVNNPKRRPASAGRPGIDRFAATIPGEPVHWLAFCGAPDAASLSSPRYLNQSFVASAILSTVHRGASLY